MRNVPLALKEKLLNQVKADSTNSAPQLRIVATQSSVNTLLSEPIHEDVPPGLGDVAIRQMEGERSISLAYAICIENGRADIYQRKLPASLDYKWEFVSQYGPAEDVAIEYDGTWVMDPQQGWYYLQTDEFPYIFTVEEGNLYVQHWNDPSTRALLAEGVSQISACKGWKNSIDTNLDQGLLIGYLRDGQVFYRAMCTQEDGTKVWETERSVAQLGAGNLTLAVVRTNDFRVGFLTEQIDGTIRLLLTHRTWAGMSVRPETVHVNPRIRFQYLNAARWNVYAKRENVRLMSDLPYFNLDHSPETPEISVASVERLNRASDFTSYGCKVVFNQPIFGEVDAAFLAKAKIVKNDGSSLTQVAITGALVQHTDNSVVFFFAEEVPRVHSLTLDAPVCRAVWYNRCPNQPWFLPDVHVEIPGETNQINAIDSCKVDMGVVMGFEYVGSHCYKEKAAAGAAVTFIAAIEYVPIQAQPI